MAKTNEPYRYIVCESFRASKAGGLHGDRHIRPCKNDYYPTTLMVEGNDKLKTEYPLGTKFKLKVKLTDRNGGRDFLYTSFRWKEEVVELGVD